jgi:hypothetical protein
MPKKPETPLRIRKSTARVSWQALQKGYEMTDSFSITGVSDQFSLLPLH